MAVDSVEQPQNGEKESAAAAAAATAAPPATAPATLPPPHRADGATKEPGSAEELGTPCPERIIIRLSLVAVWVEPSLSRF
jgi:hypothetical protein